MRWWPFGSEAEDMSRGSSRATQLRDERLSAYIDDDLTAEERTALEAELGQDTTLRDDLAGMRAVTAALGELEPVRAPRPFTLEAAPAPSRRPRFVDFGLQLGAALSALLLVVAIVDPGDGGGIASTAVPVEQSRTAESSSQFSDADDGAALAGGAAQPEQAPAAPNDGATDAGSEENGGAGSSGEATTTDEPSTPPTESLQAQPPSPTDGADAPAPEDASRDGDDGATTAPPPANTGPAAPTGVTDATSSPAESGDGDVGPAARPQPVPGTEEPLGASDLGGGETDFVPALAVLTALLTALVALRWAQTRRVA